MIKTKIVCTIGPSTDGYEQIFNLVKAGMNVARINFSHGSKEQHQLTIKNLREVRKDLNVPLAIMLDTKGPEIRIGKIPNDEIIVNTGDRLKICRSVECVPTKLIQFSILPSKALDNIDIGNRILFNDGYVSSRVVEIEHDGLIIEIENSGTLNSGKGVNVPGVPLNLPDLTNQDLEDIKFGCHEEIDLIAASFIRSAENIIKIKKILKELGKEQIGIIAKIECQEALDNFDSILQVSDGIMIARGDLGVEVPLSQVPKLQKMMIKKCYLAGKPAITATQMLESMIKQPRPTRAEVSDVANAIYDRTSAVMLSGETAVGKYPIESVNVMNRVIEVSEKDHDYRRFFYKESEKLYNDVPGAVAFSSVNTAYSANAKAIFVFTSTGYTPKLVSRLRSEIPVIALTNNRHVYHQLSLNWGIIPIFHEKFETLPEAFKICSDYALEQGIVNLGDIVVLTAGSPFGVSGTTNMMIVESIGDVLVRGSQGIGDLVYARASIVLSPEDEKQYTIKDHILVISRCDDSYLPLLKESKGVILQNYIGDIDSEKYVLLVAKTLNIPAIVRADGACSILKEGQLITLDPKKAIVYNGMQLPGS